MLNLDLDPKTKTNLPSRNLNWVIGPAIQTLTAPQAYTYAEITGDLAQEMSAALESIKIEADPMPNVAPEDFEAVYQWFIS